MISQAQLNADTAELEALFDSVANARAAPAAVTACAANDGKDGAADEVIARVGKMTRALHDSLRALGYDRALESAAASVPDARDRLAHISTMTERAAERALSAIEIAKPIQENLAADAAALSVQWDQLYARELSVDGFKQLAGQTRNFLQAVPGQAHALNAQLTEIMIAQEFQDLTGQLIKKITDVAHQLERELLKLLLENATPAKRQQADGLLNGPAVRGDGRSDVVTSQQQADELLESLGF